MKHTDYRINTRHPHSPLQRSLVGLNSSLLVKWFDAVRVEEQRHSCDDARMYTIEGESGRYYFNSVVGYAVANADCPITALARAKARKHPLWWISETCAVIDGQAKPYPRATLKQGGLVILAGRCFQLVRGHHENDYRLVQMNVPKLVERAVALEKAQTCDRVVTGPVLRTVTDELHRKGIPFRASGGPTSYVLYFDRADLKQVEAVLWLAGA